MIQLIILTLSLSRAAGHVLPFNPNISPYVYNSDGELEKYTQNSFDACGLSAFGLRQNYNGECLYPFSLGLLAENASISTNYSGIQSISLNARELWTDYQPTNYAEKLSQEYLVMKTSTCGTIPKTVLLPSVRLIGKIPQAEDPTTFTLSPECEAALKASNGTNATCVDGPIDEEILEVLQEASQGEPIEGSICHIVVGCGKDHSLYQDLFGCYTVWLPRTVIRKNLHNRGSDILTYESMFSVPIRHLEARKKRFLFFDEIIGYAIAGIAHSNSVDLKKATRDGLKTMDSNFEKIQESLERLEEELNSINELNNLVIGQETQFSEKLIQSEVELDSFLWEYDELSLIVSGIEKLWLTINDLKNRKQDARNNDEESEMICRKFNMSSLGSYSLGFMHAARCTPRPDLEYLEGAYIELTSMREVENPVFAPETCGQFIEKNLSVEHTSTLKELGFSDRLKYLENINLTSWTTQIWPCPFDAVDIESLFKGRKRLVWSESELTFRHAVEIDTQFKSVVAAFDEGIGPFEYFDVTGEIVDFIMLAPARGLKILAMVLDIITELNPLLWLFRIPWLDLLVFLANCVCLAVIGKMFHKAWRDGFIL